MDVASGELVDLVGVEEPGLGENGLGLFIDARALERLDGLVDHRGQATTLVAGDDDVDGDDDLAFGRVLPVRCSPNQPRRLLTICESGSVTLIFPAGAAGGSGRNRVVPPIILRPSAASLAERRASQARHSVLTWCSKRQSSSSRLRASATRASRVGGCFATRVELVLELAQPCAARPSRRHLRRQLVAAAGAELRVLGRVDRVGLGHDLPREIRIDAVLRTARVGVDLGAVDRDGPDLNNAAPRAKREQIVKQADQRILMPRAKARDRRVIRRELRRDHPKRNVLAAAPLDHT